MPENAGETHVKTFETSKKLQIFHEVPKFPRKCPHCLKCLKGVPAYLVRPYTGVADWRCVAPAHGPSGGIGRVGGVGVGIASTHFGASHSTEAASDAATSVRFVPAPWAVLSGGPAVGAADAAVPVPAGALFRLLASPLRSLPLWCVVGGGGGARVPTSGQSTRAHKQAECIPAEAIGAGFATVTLLW